MVGHMLAKYKIRVRFSVPAQILSKSLIWLQNLVCQGVDPPWAENDEGHTYTKHRIFQVFCVCVDVWVWLGYCLVSYFVQSYRVGYFFYLLKEALYVLHLKI